MKTVKPNLFIENIKKAYQALGACPVYGTYFQETQINRCMCPLTAFALFRPRRPNLHSIATMNAGYAAQVVASVFKNDFFLMGFEDAYDGCKLYKNLRKIFKDPKHDAQRRAFKRGYLLGLRVRREIPPRRAT